MIETPRAALRADEIAEEADFFSFGTNDLTQMTFGFSRDDVESRMMPAYLEQGLLKRNPFETIDADGVGELVRIGARARPRRPSRSCKLGVCGEHGGDPESIALFYDAGLDYVSCSPFRVPIARLAAAQAIVGAGTSDTQVTDARTTDDLAARRRGRHGNFVDLDVEPWQWAVLLGLIVALLLVDLLVVHREAHAVEHAARRRSSRRSGSRSASASRSSCCGGSAAQATGEYISGYLIEKSLSIDNVFVWALDPELLRGAAEVPAPRAVLGHLRRPRAAGDLHLRRRRPDRALRLDPVRVRRLPAVHRGPHAVRRRRARRPGQQPVPQGRQPGRAEHRPARRPAPVHAGSTAGGWPRRCSPCSCSSS